jgi:hypothetical protein
MDERTMTRVETFSKYLEVVGFPAAPFAWFMSGLPVDDHNEIIDVLGKDKSNETQ